ncbi:MFS general substrate transporter [Durotheca rogersii]|uniref:MFS general substrate transporter n=1 Tax=Durotheca rogersii TaxID=419775 RepID=UPI0022202520|nr:MFS general substrate transporter [Durotheca rogersii]KAI5861820.1 MFS general substrate transporter [Durotheca rogersii]
MSLQRVASLETFVNVPGESQRRSPRGSVSSAVASERARKLTFNPLPESWHPVFDDDQDQHLTQPVGAFEVPQWKRILQVVAAVIICLLASGIVFGYAALKPVLKDEGAYRETCKGEDACVEIRLNLMFTVAAVTTNVAALLVGAILDYYGPRVCGILGAIFLSTGALSVSFAKHLPFDAFIVGYLFLALGGPFTYISSFQLSNAFPRHSGLILALLTGAFDASSALFLVYRIIYERTEGSFGHHQFFLAYLAVPLIILVFQLTLLPKHSYKTVGEMIEEIEAPAFNGPSTIDVAAHSDDQVDEHTALLREEQRESVVRGIEELLGPNKTDVDKQAREEEAKNDRSGVWGVMHNRSAREQICSPWFVLICLFTIVQMTRINYFVATVREQYEVIFGSEAEAAALNHFFDVALPLGGIASVPLTGAVLDRTSTVTVLAALVGLAALIGVLGVLPDARAAYAGVGLFVAYRPFYYTAVSDYSAKVFGFATFGRVYGAVICLAGLFNLSQSALDLLRHRASAGDPVPVNLLLLAVGLVVGLCLVGYVAAQAARLRAKRRAREGRGFR